METCLTLIADGIVWTNIGTTTLSGRFAGKQALQEKLLGPLFGGLKAGIGIQVHRLVAEGRDPDRHRAEFLEYAR